MHQKIKETKQAIKDQDRDLESLGEGVDRLHNIAKSHNEELNNQKISLDQLDHAINGNLSQLEIADGHLKKALEKNGCNYLCLIIGLGVIIIILLFLVIYI